MGGLGGWRWRTGVAGTEAAGKEKKRLQCVHVSVQGCVCCAFAQRGLWVSVSWTCSHSRMGVLRKQPRLHSVGASLVPIHCALSSLWRERWAAMLTQRGIRSNSSRSISFQFFFLICIFKKWFIERSSGVTFTTSFSVLSRPSGGAKGCCCQQTRDKHFAQSGHSC